MDVQLKYEHFSVLFALFLICLRWMSVQARTYQHEAWDDVRLVNGGSVFQGRVEVKVNGTWGTVCDNNWSMFDGFVVCRKLGFDRVMAVFRGAHFGAGSGPIYHDNLRCRKHDPDLAHCPGRHDPRGINCSHAQDAGVKCSVPVERGYQTTACRKNQFNCITERKCIPARWACDHLADCSRLEDETYYVCHGSAACGEQFIPPTSTRIVNGNDAKLGAWPWMASLKVKLPITDKETAFCGGTLIHEDWVLTAAHCFDNYTPSTSTFRVVLGSIDELGTTSTSQEVSVEHVYLHSQYRRGSHRNDIALLKLSSQVTVGSDSYTGLACVPVFSIPPFNASDTCYISGWGTTQRSGPTTILQQAEVPILENSECKRWYNNTLTNGMMCAGYQYGGIDACHGDSGGPLSCLRDGSWYVAGIVSWGHGCAQHPGIYTDVRQYTTWIWNVIYRSLTVESAPVVVG